MRSRVIGLDAIERALRAGELRLLLAAEGDPEVAPLVELAETAGVRVWRGSAGDLRRMSPQSAAPERAIGMLGPPPSEGLQDTLAAGGALWLLAGVAYPSNAGFVLRTAEVSGASAVVIDGAFNHAQRSRIQHVGMGAHRLLPVHYSPSGACIAAARAAGFRIVAIESTGTRPPWQVDLTGNVVLVVGAERDGIPPAVLDGCDAVTCLPMPGFVPSYSLQAAVSAVAVERLRQLGC